MTHSESELEILLRHALERTYPLEPTLKPVAATKRLSWTARQRRLVAVGTTVVLVGALAVVISVMTNDGSRNRTSIARPSPTHVPSQSTTFSPSPGRTASGGPSSSTGVEPAWVTRCMPSGSLAQPRFLGLRLDKASELAAKQPGMAVVRIITHRGCGTTFDVAVPTPIVVAINDQNIVIAARSYDPRPQGSP